MCWADVFVIYIVYNVLNKYPSIKSQLFDNL